MRIFQGTADNHSAMFRARHSGVTAHDDPPRGRTDFMAKPIE